MGVGLLGGRELLQLSEKGLETRLELGPVPRGQFDARFALRLAHKDVGLAVQLGRAFGVPMRLSTLCEQELAQAMARGWGERDASIALTLQEERASVQVRLPG